MFKPELKQEINKRLAEFIQVEMGNRLTPNSWNWLVAIDLERIFRKNEVKPENKELTE